MGNKIIIILVVILLISSLTYFIYKSKTNSVRQNQSINAQKTVLLIPTPSPTSGPSPTPTPITFQFDNSTDLQIELDTVNPQVQTSDFESLKKILPSL